MSSSPFKNVIFRRSRGDEAQISSETEIYLETPHVVSYFINGLLGTVLYVTQAGRDTWSLAVALGEVIFQRAEMERLAAGSFEPNKIFRILNTFQELFVLLDRDDDGDGFAFARHDFGFGHCCAHER